MFRFNAVTEASFRGLCFEGVLVDSWISSVRPMWEWRFIVYIFIKADGFFPLKGVFTYDPEDKLIKEESRNIKLTDILK